jgi:hypothetical protein
MTGMVGVEEDDDVPAPKGFPVNGLIPDGTVVVGDTGLGGGGDDTFLGSGLGSIIY